MIKKKKGTCSKCGKKDVYLWRVKPPECEWCYKKGKQSIYREREKERKENKKRKKIKNYSNKRVRELWKYRILRDKFLEENKYCQVEGCNNIATNVHHMGGRIGKLLTHVDWFMACCSTCHPYRIHFKDVEWAKKKGYIKSVAEIDRELKKLNKEN